MDVRLLRGNLLKGLAAVRKGLRAEVLATARDVAREPLQAQLERETAALQRARAEMESGTNDGDPVSDCMTKGEARLLDARRVYGQLVASLGSRLAAAGVEVASPERALARLREAIVQKRALEARRLRTEYAQTKLVQESRLVLSMGMGADRLCWTAVNRGDVGATFRGLTILRDGQPLPYEIASRIWDLPRADAPLRIFGRDGVEREDLPPGERHEICFHAVPSTLRSTLPSHVLEAHGLTAPRLARSGQWRVRWEEISFVVSDSGGGGRRAVETHTVFARLLATFEASLEDARLVRELEESAEARSLAQAEDALVRCHRAVAVAKRRDMLARALTALTAGDDESPDLLSQLHPFVRELLQDADHIEKAAADVRRLVEKNTVAWQAPELGEEFKFPKLDPGEYTLFVESVTGSAPPEQARIWIVPLHIAGEVQRDLDLMEARVGTLSSLVEAFVLGRAEPKAKI